MKTNTQKLTVLAMLSALTYIIMLIRIPVVLFLKYEAKDVIIVIGGFIFGPLASFMISLIVSILEMFTVSDTGWIGLIMNVLASATFACTAAYIYKKNHNLKGAILGLVLGSVLTVMVMILWNYFLTPLYMAIPREAVVSLLLPAILPFNVLKVALNTAITLLIYKPLTSALKKMKLLTETTNQKNATINLGLILISCFVIISCVLLILVLQGII